MVFMTPCLSAGTIVHLQVFGIITKELEARVGAVAALRGGGVAGEVPTEPIEGMKPGTSGLRKKVLLMLLCLLVSVSMRMGMLVAHPIMLSTRITDDREPSTCPINTDRYVYVSHGNPARCSVTFCAWRVLQKSD